MPTRRVLGSAQCSDSGKSTDHPCQPSTEEERSTGVVGHICPVARVCGDEGRWALPGQEPVPPDAGAASRVPGRNTTSGEPGLRLPGRTSGVLFPAWMPHPAAVTLQKQYCLVTPESRGRGSTLSTLCRRGEQRQCAWEFGGRGSQGAELACGLCQCLLLTPKSPAPVGLRLCPRGRQCPLGTWLQQGWRETWPRTPPWAAQGRGHHRPQV